MPLADAGDVEEREDSATPADEPPVACGTVLPGAPMKSDLVEAQPNYAKELAATDISGVTDPYEYSGEVLFLRAVVNYMLGRSSGSSITHEEALAIGGMGQAVLAAAAKGGKGELDVTFLRRGFHYNYPCSRPVPADLATLRARYGEFTEWTSRTLDCSRPKNGPRRIFENHELGIYIAETLEGDMIRETEVLFQNLRDDGQFDFAVYTPEGELTDRSTFATGSGGKLVSAAPYTCMSCHVDIDSGTFSVLAPTGTGAGCR